MLTREGNAGPGVWAAMAYGLVTQPYLMTHRVTTTSPLVARLTASEELLVW